MRHTPLSRGTLCAALAAALLLATVADSLAGDTDVTVNDARDLPDPSPNLGPNCASSAGTCTLRAAIQRANNQTGTHIIRLPAGTFILTRPGRGENFANTGDLDIRGNIQILGAGARNTRINGGAINRVFDVRTGSLLLQSVTVTNGNSADEDGGGIRALGADLTLNRVHLVANVAGGQGGGLFTNHDVSIVRSAITANQAGEAGGGIRASSIFDRDFSLRDSTVSGNGDVNNTGGVFVGVSFDVVISHSTIAFNNGIGLDVLASGSFRERGVRIDHTIVANNETDCGILQDIISLQNNVDSDATCFTAAGGNLVGVDPQLSPLADNGGQTPSHVFNNPLLLDEGDGAGPTCSGIDQRGFGRPVDGDRDGLARCDIGAIEIGAVGAARLDPENATVRKGRAFNLSYLWRVPRGEVWRDIQTLDLRVREHGKVVFWVRWSESDDTFQLIDPRTRQARGSIFPAGSDYVLDTKDVSLDLRDTSSVGSGPTGQEVTLHLALFFEHRGWRDEPFQLDVTATNDAGETQPFAVLGAVAVDAGKGSGKR